MENKGESVKSATSSSSAAWADALCAWFHGNRRMLPWREEPTPYRVLVSEFMLQQTQVATVLPYFNRFMALFPTVEALAAADSDDVLKAWEGLGYYNRARRLQSCAREICLCGFPSEPVDLERLPGIGGYTAAAISSIAFGKRYPVVDGNVLRVRARMTADDEPTDSAKVKSRYYDDLLEVISAVSDASVFNQAMMELGALVCHPLNPQCGECPVRRWCVSAEAGTQLQYPKRVERPPVPHYHVSVAIILAEGRMLILRRGEEQMLGGLWEFPGGKLEVGETAAEAVVREVKEETGLDVSNVREITVVRHAYSHFKITMHAFVCSMESRAEALSTDRPYRWIRPSEREQYAFPKANHKIFTSKGFLEAVH